MKRLILGILLASYAIVLIACNPGQPKSIPSTKDYPTPSVTQDPKMGRVQAVILYETQGQYLPFKLMDFYITPILSDPTGNYRVTGLDRATAPGARTDEKGFLYFPNVAPGEYALIIDNVTQGWLLPETTGKGAITVKVEAGKLTDLGTLKYQSLPITPIP